MSIEDVVRVVEVLMMQVVNVHVQLVGSTSFVDEAIWGRIVGLLVRDDDCLRRCKKRVVGVLDFGKSTVRVVLGHSTGDKW